MLRKFFSVPGLVTLGFILSGCTSRPPEIKPNKTVPVMLEAGKKLTTVEVGIQNLITLTLPPAEPGQAWQIAFHDPGYLKQTTEIKPAVMAGGGATVSFVVLRIGIGRTRLRFLLVPLAGGREARPVDQLEIILSIQ